MNLRRINIIRKLREAADLMLKGGYLKGQLNDDRGAHCALGAIYDVTGGREAESAESTEMIEAVSKMVVDKIPAEGIKDSYNHMTVRRTSAPHQHVFAWNNNIADSAEDVACVLRATAELLEEEENEQHETES